jgi:DNA-binding NtrC family response regulator
MSWMPSSPIPHVLQGSRVLVVENEWFIAIDVESMLADAGASVVGPVATVDEALALVRSEPLSAAVLDMRLRDESIEPVAEALHEHGTPFLFYSGQLAKNAALQRWPDAVFLAKPAPSRLLVEAVRDLVAADGPATDATRKHDC